MGRKVVHFEIHGKTDLLNDFYKDLFDWHIDTNNPMNYGMVDTHGGEGGINGGIAPDDDPWVTIYVDVDDLQAALDKAEQLGGKTVMPPAEVGPVSLALFTDPAGNRVGLVKGM
ncbi:MAG: VOC family protein [Actinomycetota bacterium]